MGKKATFYLFHWIFIVVTILLAILVYITLYTEASSVTKLSGMVAILFPIIICWFIYFTILWAIKLKIAVIFAIAGFVLSYPYLTSVFQTGSKGDEIATSKKSSPKNIKVATFNSQWFGGEQYINNIRGCTYFFAAQNVDVIFFQEYVTASFFSNKDFTQLMQKYPYSCSSKSADQREDVAIFSRYPIISWKKYLFPSSKYGFIKAEILVEDIDKYLGAYKLDSLDKHVADSVRFHVIDSLSTHDANIHGKILTLYNTHFETTGTTETVSTVRRMRKSGLSINKFELAQRIFANILYNSEKRGMQVNILYRDMVKSRYPVILCGDFNDLPSSYSYLKLTSCLSDGFKESGHGWGYTYNGLLKQLRIDYIMHSKDFRCVNYYSFYKEWSDHNPVIAELQLK